MDHFSDQAWADFARGFNASEGIAAHLSAGCLSCKTARGFWDRVHTMALEERAYSAPEDLVRLAKLEFSARQELNEPWTLASTVFDTFSNPLFAGVRSAGAAARQVIYQAEGLTVDLRLERMVSSGKVSAVGQILDSHTKPLQLNGAPVAVWSEEGRLVATTTANPYGEFQLEFEARNDLRLTARVGDRRVRMPLTNMPLMMLR